MKYKIIRPPLAPRFHLPTKDELFKVCSGDHLQLMFQVGNDIVERMWVKLEKCYDENEWTGKLDNQPIGEKNSKILRPGIKVRFHPYDVISIIPQGASEASEFEDMITAGVKAAIPKRWWEKNWVQIIFILGAIAGIYALFR